MHSRTGTYLGTLLVVFVALTQQATAEHLQAERHADVIRVTVMDHLSLEEVRVTPVPPDSRCVPRQPDGP